MKPIPPDPADDNLVLQWPVQSSGWNHERASDCDWHCHWPAGV